jgi:NAD(P)-dependent dehydrogenase (short-subunit alcohol dehydrogenase family)
LSNSSNTFDNKVVLITGAKGGLGSSVTEAFLAAGATVAGVSRSIQDSDFDSPRFYAVPGELTSPDAAKSVVDAVIARSGRVDVLAHLVGAFAPGSDEAVMDQMWNVNFRSTVLIVNAVLPHMKGQGAGRIIATGSRAAVEASPGVAAYAASKAAVVSFIKSVAAENLDSGISANAVLPGTMDTAANRKAMPGADFSKWVRTEQVAQLILALASDDMSDVRGAAIPIYGSSI